MLSTVTIATDINTISCQIYQFSTSCLRGIIHTSNASLQYDMMVRHMIIVLKCIEYCNTRIIINRVIIVFNLVHHNCLFTISVT